MGIKIKKIAAGTSFLPDLLPDFAWSISYLTIIVYVFSVTGYITNIYNKIYDNVGIKISASTQANRLT